MRYLLITCFIFFTGFSAGAQADECARYMDDTYRYSICVPVKWNKSYTDAGNRHVLNLAGKAGAGATVSASRYEGEEKTKWENWRRWYVRKIGHHFTNIIESKDIPAGSGVTIKLLVFEYSSRAGRMLQRTMLMKYGENILAVECRAPLRLFARHTDQFNKVMSSIDTSDNLQGERMELLKRPDSGSGAVARKRRTDTPKTVERIKPKPKPKPKPEPDVIKHKEPAPDAENKQAEKAKPNADINKGDTTPAEAEVVNDPETKRVIEAELKKIQDLEQKGIIEKVDGK
jgi:hypothetical protein